MVAIDVHTGMCTNLCACVVPLEVEKSKLSDYYYFIVGESKRRVEKRENKRQQKWFKQFVFARPTQLMYVFVFGVCLMHT